MKKSTNLLVMENMTVVPKEDGHGECVMMMYVSELTASIQFNCPVTGNKFREIKLTANGSGQHNEAAIKEAIQNFMFGRFQRRDSIFDVNIQCLAHHGIDGLRVNMPEPYKSLFNQLFDASQWMFEYKIEKK